MRGTGLGLSWGARLPRMSHTWDQHDPVPGATVSIMLSVCPVS